MTIENELRNCLLKYPSIFPNKWAVYHHLFIVNGNGYEWENGELTIEGEDEMLTVEDAIVKQDEKLAANLSKGESDFSNKFYRERHAKAISLIKNLDERMGNFTTDRKEMYPMCKYAMILTIPSDVKPEWKEAVQEMYTWLKENHDDLGKENQKYINLIKL